MLVSVDGFDRARHRANQAFEVAAQHGDESGVAVFAAVGIFEAVLALPANPTLRVASKPKPNLVHALVKPLDPGMFAGLPAMQGCVFRSSAPGKPEGDGGYEDNEDDQGNAHCHSVGLHGSWLKSSTRRFFVRRVVKIGAAARCGGPVFSQEGEK